MEFFELLILLLFILLPLFGGAGKKKRRGGRKPDTGDDSRQPSPGRPRAPGPAAEPPPRAESDADAQRETAAADMVPDDLWAVLTGEPGGQTSPEKAPESRSYESERADETAVATANSEDATAATTADPAAGRTETARPVEDYAGAAEADIPDESQSAEELPHPDYPRVVSLEQRPLPPEVKKHLELAGPPAPSGPAYRIHPRHKRSAAMRRLGLGNRSELRRAVVLREVLGPPKGLEF